MATSRYGGDSAGTNVNVQGSSAPAQSILAPGGSVVTLPGSEGTSSSSKKSTTTATSSQLDPQSQAVLTALLAQLAGGGTPAMQASQTQRNQAIAAQQQQAGQYSKAAAFSDAQGAMQAQMAEVLRQLLPNIVRAAEGAGTSQNSLRALLSQQAGQQAAAEAAKLGLTAATNYGNIANQAGSTLASLVNNNSDAATQALIQALSIAKGANTTSNSTTTETGSVSQPAASRGGAVTSYGAPMQTASTQNSFSPDPGYQISSFGPSTDGNTYSTSGQSLIDFISSTQDPWTSYSF